MDIELRINGQPTEFTAEGSETTWSSFRAALLENLVQHGWVPREIRLDGQVMADDAGESPIDLGSGRHVVEVDAVPSPEGVERMAREITEVIPAFVTRTQELGEAFQRGDWRPALSTTPAYLGELQMLLGGIQAVAAFRGDGVTKDLASLPDVLQNLSRSLERQSWVEMADLLLFELAPLLERLAVR